MPDGMDLTHQARLNLCGLHCPTPIIRCRAMLQRLAAGESVQVTTDNLDATRDLLLWLQRGGARYLHWWHDAQGFHFLIQKPVSPRRPLATTQRSRLTWARLREWLRMPSAAAC